MTNVIINLRLIQYPFKTKTYPVKEIQNYIKMNTISSIDKWNIEIFPDLIFAVQLDTSSQFVASVFGQPLVVRIHGNFEQVCSNQPIIHSNTNICHLE